MASTPYPHLTLTAIQADPELAHQLPPSLMAYYLALPVAREGRRISVVMAHPDNTSALAVLGSLLKAEIVPVQGTADEIREAISLVWQGRSFPMETRILAWNTPDDRSGTVTALAQAFGAPLSAPVIGLAADQISLDTVLTVAREGQYSLTVIRPPDGEPLSRLVRRSATPLLIARGEHLRMGHILAVIRGYSSDENTLDWIVPLAAHTGAAITLLVLTALPVRSLPDLLWSDRSVWEHLETCTNRLDSAGVRGYLKLRQGDPASQIADELEQGDYDLLSIAAEAQGDFVNRVLSEIETRNLHAERPVLIVKPVNPLVAD